MSPARFRPLFWGGLVLLFCLGLAAPARADAAEPPWLGYAEAMEQAKRRPRPVMLLFGAPWCYLCREFNARVLADPLVIKRLSEEFWPVKVDVTKTPDLKDKFKISFLPTVIFLSHTGQVILRRKNYIPKEEFLKLLSLVKRRDMAPAPGQAGQ